MDPNIVHRQFLPGYSDPATWSSILYNYGGQGPANQLHDLRAEQPRALPHDSQRQQITGHDIAEFFARNTAPPVTILNECHLQPQQQQPQQPVSTAPHDVVLNLGLSAVVTPKKNDKEPAFIQDSAERSRFDKRRLKTLKSTLTGWYKRSGCVTIALTYHDGQVHISGPDHMMSLSRNEEFKNIFLNALTSYDQLSRLADIVSNCNEEDNVTDQLSGGPVQASDIQDDQMVDHGSDTADYPFVTSSVDQGRTKPATEEQLVFDQDCKICPQKFSSKHFLKKHMLEVHNQATPLLACTFCKKQFMTRWKLERHTISHTGAKPYNCIYCPKRFAEKNKLVVHVKNHKEEFVDPQAVERLINSLLPKRKASHDCVVCSKSFLSSWKLNRHMRIHSGEKPFKCSKCPKSFIEKSKLDQHEQLPHDGLRVRGGSLEKRHACEKCGKKFVSQWKLKRHELFHSGERPWQCEQCGKGFVENNKLMLHKKFFHSDKDSIDAVHKNIVRSKKYECSDCNKKFATQWKLKRHSQTHSLERPFRCELCKRGFLTRNKLDLHNFTLHSDEGKDARGHEAVFVEPADSIVESLTPDDETLPDAEGLPNTKSEPLRLPGLTVESEKHKEFTVVSDRSDHSEPITGEMEKVTLLTTDPSAIKSAMEFNLAEDGPSKLVGESKTCGECGKVFKTPSRLRRHMAVHTGVRPFKCKVCEKGFTERNKLLHHLKTHGVDDPDAVVEKSQVQEEDGGLQQPSGGKHLCNVCNRSFVSPWKLKRHQTVHTGKKPFFCKICEKAFAEKNKLENHFKSNHPSDVNFLEEDLAQAQVTMVEQDSAFSIVARTVEKQVTFKEGSEENEKTELNLGSVVPKSHCLEVAAQCPICSAAFDSVEKLNSHVQLIHSEDDSIVVVEQKSELIRGQNRQLKYCCQTCGKNFITPSKLKRHSFSHGEEKPFKCKKCGKRFSENNKLFNHLTTHDKPRSSRVLPKLQLKERGSADAELDRLDLEEASTSPVTINDSLQGVTNLLPTESKDHPVSQTVVACNPRASPSIQPVTEATSHVVTESQANSVAGPSRSLNSTRLGVITVRGVDFKANTKPLAKQVNEMQRLVKATNTVKPISSSKHHEISGNVSNNPDLNASDRSEQSPDLPVVVTSRDIIRSNSESLKMLVENAIGSTMNNDMENNDVRTGISSAMHEVLAIGSQANAERGMGSSASAPANSQPVTYVNASSGAAATPVSKSVNSMYTCDICQESFSTLYDVKHHKVVSHASVSAPRQTGVEELKYKCTECSKGFKTPSKLKRHQLSHTGETPFHCSLCPKQFKRKDSLRKHIEDHKRKNKDVGV